MEILLILSVLLNGFFVYKKYKKNPSYRRGLLTSTINIGSKDIKCTSEVIELERIKDKSKIKVVDIKFDDSTANSRKDSILTLFNGWIGTSEVDWFESDRERTIRDILK
jgi:hypothetical protein